MSKTLLLLTLLCTVGTSVFATDAKLVLVGSPVIPVDPVCNPDGAASGKAKIRNEGSAGTATISLYLSAADVSSKPSGKVFTGKVVATPINGPNDEQPSGKKALAPGEELWLKIAVSGAGEGEWEAVLQNENVDMGKIRIIRNEPPFPVSMDVATPDAPELTFLPDRPASFRLKNDGPKDYLITWEYSIEGHKLRPTDAQPESGWLSRTLSGEKNSAQKTVAPSPVELPRGGLTPVNFTVPGDWFGSYFVGLFKDNVQDGRLMVSRVDPTCRAPIATKFFKVKTHLATSSGSTREFWSDVVIFLVLLLGGICSLTLNFALPNQMRRQKLKEKLGALGRQVSNLSTKLASRLRVLAGLEQRLLGDRLRNLTWTNPDFTTEMQNIELAAGQVDKRMQLLDRLGAARTMFENYCSLDLPPTVIVGLEDIFEKVGAIAKKPVFTDADIQAAQALIQSIQDQMDSKSSPALVDGLPQRLTAYREDFDPNGAIGKIATWQRIKVNLQGAENRLKAAPQKPAEKDYLVLDRALFKMELTADYVRLVDPLASTDALWLIIKPHEPDLMNALKLDSWDQLNLARHLLEQMRQGKFAEDISKAVNEKKVKVKVDRVLIRQFEPCDFWVDFPPELASASARSDWTCKWEFSNAKEQALLEEGWQVSHYFQRAENYSLKVTLIKNSDRTEVAVDPAAIPPIQVQEEKRRRWVKVIGAILSLHWTDARQEWKKSRTGAVRVLELLWLSLAMLLALIGMIAGAKEQILKLDVVPAMIAVFLVGCGADQVKNLLTRRQT